MNKRNKVASSIAIAISLAMGVSVVSPAFAVNVGTNTQQMTQFSNDLTTYWNNNAIPLTNQIATQGKAVSSNVQPNYQAIKSAYDIARPLTTTQLNGWTQISYHLQQSKAQASSAQILTNEISNQLQSMQTYADQQVTFWTQADQNLKLVYKDISKYNNTYMVDSTTGQVFQEDAKRLSSIGKGINGKSYGQSNSANAQNGASNLGATLGMLAAAYGSSNEIFHVGDALGAGQKEQIKGSQNLENEKFQQETDIQKKLLATDQQLKYKSQTASFAQLGDGNCNGYSSTKFLGMSGKLPAIGDPTNPAGMKDKGLGKVDAYWANIDPKKVNNAIFNPDATDKEVMDNIAMLTMPYPVQDLPKDQQSTPDGKAHQSQVNVLKARVSLAQQSLKSVAEYNRPIPDSDPYRIAKAVASMTELDDSQLPKAGDKVSLAQLRALAVKGTYENPNWYQWLDRTNETGAWRAVAYLQAQLLAASNEKKKLMHQLSSMMSGNSSLKTNEQLDTISDSRARASVQSVQGIIYKKP